MTSIRRTVILVASCGCLMAGAARAQETSGSIVGFLRDETGVAVADAQVISQGAAPRGARGTVSKASGYFEIDHLPVGIYTVKIAHVGYRPVTVNGVVVALGRTTSVGDVRLDRKVLEMPEVVITADPVGIDPERSSLATVMNRETVAGVPSDRNFHSLVGLSPSASIQSFGAEPAVSGSTWEGNYYYIDGTDATDPSGGGLSTAMPHDFVESMSIRTGAFEAEFGQALGAIVDVVTPSPGDRVHGNIFGYYTDQGLVSRSSNSLFEAPAGDFSSYDVGGSAGGPLGEHVGWFAAYNPAWDHSEVVIPGIPTQSAPSTAHRFAGKLQWNAFEDTDLEATVVGDPKQFRYVGLPLGGAPDLVLNEDVVLADMEEGGINASIRARTRIRKDSQLEAVLSRVRTRSSFIPATELGLSEPYYHDLTTNTVSGGTGGIRDEHADRWAGRLHGTLAWSKHTWKAGLEYADNSYTHNNEYGAGTSGEGQIFKQAESSYVWVEGYDLGDVSVRTWTAFLQDSWMATHRLNLKAGLRWDAHQYVGSSDNKPLEITDQFQPRIGLAYTLDNSRSSKVFGSFGIFYSQIPVISPGYYFVNGLQQYVFFDHDPRQDPGGGDTTAAFTGSPGIQDDLEGQRFIEYVGGYERILFGNSRVSIAGRYRRLQSVVEDGYSEDFGDFVIGNPGRGYLSAYPKPLQEYQAIELTWDRSRPGDPLDLHASYVLSRNRGNYEGLVFGNGGPQYDFVETTEHSSGPLPTDRTHQFKIYGSRRFPFGLTVGTSFLWQSGTPVSELGAIEGLTYSRFLSPRGSVGRTPAIWDWNLRFAFDGWSGPKNTHPRLMVDLYHVFSQHRPVELDQQHYFAVDDSGNQTSPNPNYLQPTLYQPEFHARIGAGLTF